MKLFGKNIISLYIHQIMKVRLKSLKDQTTSNFLLRKLSDARPDLIIERGCTLGGESL